MRRILAVVAGVVSGFAIVFAGDAITHSLHPVPVGMNYMDKAIVLEYVAGIPMYILVLMSVFWICSAFAGGIISALISMENWQRTSLSTGAILMAASLLNLIMTIPAHPVWMWVVSLAGHLPAAWLGGWLMAYRRKKKLNIASGDN